MPLRPAVLLLSALLGLARCVPDAIAPLEKLPEATQTGQNTAGCRVDGLLWLPRNGGFVIGRGLVSAHWFKTGRGGHELSLYFRKAIDEPHVHDRTSVLLRVPDVLRPGTFALDQHANPQFGSGTPPYGGFNFSRAFPNDQLVTGPSAPSPAGRDPARHPGPRRVGHV